MSIKWKVFKYIGSFCMVFIGLIWLFQIVLLDGFYRQIRINTLKREMAVVSKILEQSDFADRWASENEYLILQSDAIKAVADRLERHGDLRLELWTEWQTYFITGGGWEGASSRLAISQYSAAEKYEYASASQEKKGTVDDSTWYREREYALCAKTIPGINEEYILLILNTSLTPVGAAKQALTLQLIVISVLMIGIAVGLALIISKKVAHPIEELVESAKDLGQGKYETSFSANDYTEIALLSETLSDTAAQLGKTDRLRRELIANVSHDLRTPLTLITGYAEMIRDLPDENTPENMQIIIDETCRLTSLVTGLLDLSQLETGTVQMNMQEFNITHEVKSVIGRFAEFCRQQGFVISFEAAGQIIVRADLQRIMQVVYNYITNAINHSGNEKRITVRQYIGEVMVTITVTDTGSGIDWNRQELIWDRYYKISDNYKRDDTASGLGLSIVKNILLRHPGADFGVHPGEKNGSTFWFSLPIPR